MFWVNWKDTDAPYHARKLVTSIYEWGSILLHYFEGYTDSSLSTIINPLNEVVARVMTLCKVNM